MENASKALLIAGAILLVIAIIGIGMSIFNQAQDIVDDATAPMDSLLISAHNNRFNTYGKVDAVKGSLIATLVSDTAAYNESLTDNRLKVNITVKDGVNTYTVLARDAVGILAGPQLYRDDNGKKVPIVNSRSNYTSVVTYSKEGAITQIDFELDTATN